MGQKYRAKFSNFDPCTVRGKTMPVSGGVYLPAFGATPLRTVIPAFGATPQYYSYKEPNDCTADCNLNVNSGVQQQGVPEWLVAQKAQDLEQRQHYCPNLVFFKQNKGKFSVTCNNV